MKTTANTILITGGATGIGLALARELVDLGNDVIICGRRAQRLDEAKAAIPQLHTRVADVSDRAAREELVAWATAAFPSLNVVVNNAGVQHRVDFRSPADLAKADEEIATNLTAPIHLSALLFEHLARQPEAAMVNISSGLAFTPLAHMPVYCATKAALHSLTMSLRHQLRATNVRVFEIAPPIVTSELGAAHRPPQMNATAMPAEEAARGIVDALANDRFEVGLGDAAKMMEARDALFAPMNARF